MRNVLLSFGLVVFIPCGGGLYAADSDFRITEIRQLGTDQVEIGWTSVRGRWYRLDRATELLPGDFSIAMPNLEANPPSNSYSDTPGGASCLFYRVAATGLPVPYPEPVIGVMGVSEAPVNATLRFDGEGSFSSIGRNIVRWQWRVDRPAPRSVGSAYSSMGILPMNIVTGETPVPRLRMGQGEVLQLSDGFIPSPDVSSPTFTVDVPGTYTFYLDVWDERDLKSWRSATYRVTVIPFDTEHKDEGTSGDDNQIALGTVNADRILQSGYGGNDTQYAGGDEGNDWIDQDGGAGDDQQTAYGGSGNNSIFQNGGDGSDSVTADASDGNDIIVQLGGGGDDEMGAVSAGGDDMILQNGMDGHDTLRADGGAGNDTVTIDGGAGQDVISYTVSAGEDTAVIDGGADADALTINSAYEQFTVVSQGGSLLYQSGEGGSVITVNDIEQITVIGDDGQPVFEIENGQSSAAGSGDDIQIAIGTTGVDWIVQRGYGGSDTQYVSASTGNDWIEQDGGTGADTQTARAGTGNDHIFIHGGDGSDVLYCDGGDGNDVILQLGGAGDDDMGAFGGDGVDDIDMNSGPGHDIIEMVGAGGGDDTVTIDGGGGQDSIHCALSLDSAAVLIDGGEDVDAVTIWSPDYPVTVLDEEGNVLYEFGEGGSVITVKNVEHLVVIREAQDDWEAVFETGGYHRDHGGDEADIQTVIGTTEVDWIVQWGFLGNETQYVSGGDGDDWIEQDGGASDDTQTARGGSGNDHIFQEGDGDNDSQSADGADGNDIILQFGDSGDDEMSTAGGWGDDYIAQNGGGGDDAINVESGDGDDVIRISAGAGQDAITYDVSNGQDTVVIDGGADTDTLTINSNNGHFALLGEAGQVLYQSGQGGSIIAVENVEHITVLGNDFQPVFEWHAL